MTTIMNARGAINRSRIAAASIGRVGFSSFEFVTTV